MTRLSKLISRAGLVAVLAVPVLAIGAAPASASAFTCTTSHGVFGSTCLLVNGSSNYVSTAVVSHDDGVAGGNLCAFQAKIEYRLDIGVNVISHAPFNTECAWLKLENTFQINSRLASPSYVYGQMYHSGSWAPGRPRITVSA